MPTRERSDWYRRPEIEQTRPRCVMAISGHPKWEIDDTMTRQTLCKVQKCPWKCRKLCVPGSMPRNPWQGTSSWRAAAWAEYYAVVSKPSWKERSSSRRGRGCVIVKSKSHPSNIKLASILGFPVLGPSFPAPLLLGLDVLWLLLQSGSPFNLRNLLFCFFQSWSDIVCTRFFPSVGNFC